MISQPTSESGCGIACVASIIGKSYQDTRRLLVKHGCKNRGSDNVKVEHALTFLNQCCDGLSAIKKNSLGHLKGAALIYTRYEGDRRYKHWLLYCGGRYWDPAPNEGGILTSYPSPPEHIFALYSNGKPLKLNLFL